LEPAYLLPRYNQYTNDFELLDFPRCRNRTKVQPGVGNLIIETDAGRRIAKHRIAKFEILTNTEGNLLVEQT
jgi:hypothetical protein